MLLDWEEEVSRDGGAPPEEVTSGSGSDDLAEVIGGEAVIDESAGVLEAGSVEGSGACEDWAGVALTSCFCSTADDGRGWATSVAVLLAVDFAMGSVLNDAHSEGPLPAGSFHCKSPSSIPSQTSSLLTVLPLKTKATTVGPGAGTTTVLTTSAERLIAWRCWWLCFGVGEAPAMVPAATNTAVTNLKGAGQCIFCLFVTGL